MSRVRYSVTLRGDAPLGPGGTFYAVIGTPVYDSDHNDVGRVSHAQQTPRELQLQLELEVFGVDWREVEEDVEEAREDGVEEGAVAERLEIVSRLANWPVDELTTLLRTAPSTEAVREAIAKRAETQ